ncbi:membrane protein implicated in regulation of membrane protease activity [Mycobacterium sp. OAS707]|uniref:hypothetical protein n=1 Tax=Mycobacterium sp. OAS707 TaxID=2663822 RepID=UPI0017892402|nr:hypothetical protein [Mycobacterium sp. OAS707]MBE1552265.1 membrane protein implicated in regulation of membrane protease activity [Mycobacterium sp. OAS707]
MRIVFAFLVMGTIAFAVALIAVAEALVAALPYLAVALVAVLVLRLLERNRRTPPTPVRPEALAPPPGWILVPVQMVPIEAPRPPVIDIDVLDENGTRRE